MPYSAEHRARTRSRIVDAARRLFNRFGFEQVSIDQIMAGAGLTRGGFYHHFQSKDELYVEAVRSFKSCNPFAAHLQSLDPPIREPLKLARMLITLYLCDETLEDPDSHCPLYALPCDVARAGLAPQRAYTGLIRSMTAIFRAALAGCPDAEQRSQTIVTLCVGGMVLARTTSDAALRRSLRSASQAQAITLLGDETAQRRRHALARQRPRPAGTQIRHRRWS